jgi:hypothetical protein
LVAVTYDVKEQRVRLVAHRLFRPRWEDIDFSEVENAVVDFRQRFAVQSSVRIRINSKELRSG